MNNNFIEEYDIIVIGAGHGVGSLQLLAVQVVRLLATINIEMLAYAL